jgi:UPF0755 protein
MNDIMPPKRPLNPAAATGPRPMRAQEQSGTNRQPAGATSVPPAQQKKPPSPSPRPMLPAPKRSFKKLLWWLIGGFVALVLLVAGSAIAWYTLALQPVNTQATEKVPMTIVEGDSPGQIGQTLQDQGIIRSSLAFDIYIRLEGVRGLLQAGTYSLSPSETTQEIVAHLTSGNSDMLTVTFLPGATLAENRQVLLSAGFSEAEIDTAFGKTYESPLFADKPAEADLEGYIYGETYTFAADVTVEAILERTFAEFWQAIEENDIVAGFETQGLNLYEGITLASIVQREDGNPDNQANIARVFLNRLGQDMMLGSDVTYYYGAA